MAGVAFPPEEGYVSPRSSTQQDSDPLGAFNFVFALDNGIEKEREQRITIGDLRGIA